MKKVRHILVKILIYAAVAGVACGGGWWGYKAYKNASMVEGEIDKINVSRGDVEIKFQDIGDVSPKDALEVYSRVGGRISALLVKEGDIVTKGQKVAVVQPGQSDTDKYVPVDVTSPIDGTVMVCGGDRDGAISKLDQRIGGLADGSPTCLMQVGDMRSLVVDLSISEMEIMKLRVGMPVKVTIDALPSQKLSGHIKMIGPKAESGRGNSKSFKVEIGIDQRNIPGVKSGMTSRIEAVMESRHNVLKLPISGLFEEGGRHFAYLYVPGGKSRKVDVKTGLRNETDVEIVSGLTDGATVYADKPMNVEADAPGAKKAGYEAGEMPAMPASSK